MMIDVKNVGFTEVRNSNAEFRINVAIFLFTFEKKMTWTPRFSEKMNEKLNCKN